MQEAEAREVVRPGYGGVHGVPMGCCLESAGGGGKHSVRVAALGTETYGEGQQFVK